MGIGGTTLAQQASTGKTPWLWDWQQPREPINPVGFPVLSIPTPSPKTWRLHGRREPYTDAGIRRLPCFRCGAKATEQWQICADGNLYRPLCRPCGTLLNRQTLEFMGFVDTDTKMARYEARPLTPPPR